MIDSISFACHSSFDTNQCDVCKFKRSNYVDSSTDKFTSTFKELEEPRPTSDVSTSSSSLASLDACSSTFSLNSRQLARHLIARNLNRPAFRTRTFCALPLLTALFHLALLFTVGLLFSLSSLVEAQTKEFTNEFAVELDSNSICSNDDLHVCKTRLDQFADRLAVRHGFVNQGQIGTLHGHYLFRHHRISKRSLTHASEHHEKLQNERHITWVEQQEVKKRFKRDNMNTDFRYTDPTNDPLLHDQWYINKGAYGGFDMNVEGAWALGYTGKGVVVSILDDGIQPNHPDLVKNYDPRASYDINQDDSDPTPQNNGENKHGTRCAGEVAAEANNGICGVGIAFNASIGGVRMLDGTVTDQVEARALSFNIQHIDIYSASWGPEDDGKTVDGPGRLAKRAFIDGIRHGRNKLGSIYVWASGNGGRRYDNCNCDGYTNSIYTLSISSATQAGTKPWYLEECSSTLATTYSSGTPGKDANIVTVDMDVSFMETGRQDQSLMCTKSHTGTSASAPIAAGMCALALEANPNLTWRDMQHLVVITSRFLPLLHEPGWSINGVGRHFSHKFGYGLMDGEALVRYAEKWINVPDQELCETIIHETKLEIPSDYNRLAESSIFSNGCKSQPGDKNAAIEVGKEINYLEHVQVKITLKFSPRGNLQITLISPKGTESHLLFPRPRDLEESNFNAWPFLSVHFWGENPQGVWKLRIRNAGDSRDSNGYLQSWGLIFHGTTQAPVYPSFNQTKRRREFTGAKLNARSSKLVAKSDSEVTSGSLISSLKDKSNQSIMNSEAPLFKSNYPKTISLTVYSVIIIVCMASVSVFLLIFVVIQLTSSRPTKLTLHNYRPLQLNSDDEEEVSFFERKA